MVQIGAQYMGDDRGPKAFAQRTEAAGFDSLWCGDHIAHYVEGIATLGCYAGATERITIVMNGLRQTGPSPASAAASRARRESRSWLSA